MGTYSIYHFVKFQMSNPNIFALWPSNFVFLYDNAINHFVVNLSERFRDREKREMLQTKVYL